MNIQTIIAQAGICTDESTGAISTPIHQTSTFRHSSTGQSTGFDYSRSSNPTRQVLEDTAAKLEGGKRGFAFSSGMAAITAVMSLFSKGDHILLSDDLYGGTYRLFQQIASRFGIGSSFADMSVAGYVQEALRPETAAIFIETPSNPMMKITDIEMVASIAKSRGIPFIVDNTFMTPYFQRPVEHGADIVVHSGTKFLSGHNDTLSGIIVTANDELGERIAFIQNATGGVLAPFDSWLTLRGIKTLSVRLERSETNAHIIANWLLGRSYVNAVYYPGIPESKGYHAHKRQAKGFGSVISFRLKDRDMAERVINNVKLVSYAESLGGVESLITYPYKQTHSDMPAEIRERLGITDTLVRLSVGIESAGDVIDDLRQALEEWNYEI